MAGRTHLALCAAIAIASSLLVATGARAEETEETGEIAGKPWLAPHWQISTGMDARRLYCLDCSGADNPGYLGFFVEPAYRFSRLVTLGPLASFAVRPGAQGVEGGGFGIVEHQSLARFVGDLRLHGQTGRSDLWFGIEAGLAEAYYSVHRYGSVSNPGSQSSWQSAPVMGIGGGIDVRASRVVSLGVEARALVWVFSRSSTGSIDRFKDATPSMSFGLAGTFDL